MMRLSVEEKKANLLGEFRAVRHAILDAASGVPPEQAENVFLGAWSLMDLLAHLAGWDDANREGARAVLAGQLPAFYAFIDKDWKTFNARLVTQFKKGSLSEMIACVSTTHQQLLDALEGIPSADLFKDWGVGYKGYRVIVARLLQSEIDDERAHLDQINRFISQG